MNLKNDIKELVKEQLILKNERKTVNRVGPETSWTPWQAAGKHLENRWMLRHMYIVYGEMRGKSIDVIEHKNTKNPPNERMLENLRKRYATPIETQETLISPEPRG
jgi:hypothetical protein